jgi:prepilin-type N-terminal cleavage/methylation domain-containing protein
MIRTKPNKKSDGGFTIVELLMASVVFSTVLLVALLGFLQLGRVFYKGVSNTQTQDTVRQVANDIAANIKTSSASTSIQTPPAVTGGGYQYSCVGTYRYTWGTYTNNTNTALNGHPIIYVSTSPANYDAGSPNANFGLLRDKTPGEGTCPVPCVANGSPSSAAKCPSSNFLALDTNNPTEMLANGMRIGSLTISQVAGSTDLYNLSAMIAYGDDTVLAYNSSGQPYCVGNSSDQKFCAVDQYSTTIFRGELHP